MPRYYVRQPNGLLAEFSTIVDGFTILNMTEAEAVEHAAQSMTREEAVAKVRRGVEDAEYRGGPANELHGPPGLRRWCDSLRTILAVKPWSEFEQYLRDYPDIFIEKPASVRTSCG